MAKKLASHLRPHRKKSGLSQGELARLVGYKSDDPVSRHEQGVSIPPFLVALAYEAIFGVPVSKLFPGIYEAVELGVEARLRAMEKVLQEKDGTAHDANVTARKLEWLCMRRLGNQH